MYPTMAKGHFCLTNSIYRLLHFPISLPIKDIFYLPDGRKAAAAIWGFCYFQLRRMNQKRNGSLREDKVSLVEKLQRRLSLPHRKSGQKLSRSQSGYRYRIRAHDIGSREENDDKCNYMMWSGNIALVVATFCNASLWLLLMGRMKILNKPIVSSLWSLHIRDFNFDDNIVMNTQYCLEQLIALSHTLRI